MSASLGCLKMGGLILLVLFLICWPGISQEYKVGPGDVLYVVVWGYDELSGPVPVSPDGTIALPQIGVIRVKGLTTEEISKLLTERLSVIIRNPQVTVSLREFGYNVHIYGEVVNPGYYKVPDKTTLQEVISRAGGLTPYADTEHIRITSFKEGGSQTVREVNFHQFLRENDESANPFVMSDDLIFVPRLKTEEYLKKVVSVLGSVQKPGVFPMEEDRRLMDVISLAGGVTVDADLEKVSLVDLDPDQRYDVQVIDLKRYLQGNDPSSNPIIHPGMVIYVPTTRIPEELTYPINVVGQVLRPGVYRVKAEKARVLDAIFSAGGFAQGADIERVTVIPDRGEMKRLNLKRFLIEGDMSQNPRLDEGDTVIVPVSPLAKQLSVVDTAFVPYKTISVIGEVRNPGTFQVPTHASLLDLLIIAGGTTSAADLERVTLIRKASEGRKFEVDVKRVLTEGEFSLLPELESGDTVFIPQKKESIWRQTVRLAADLSTIAALILILMGRR